jgi:DNA-directed RNA polymerase subunit beta'
MVEREPPEVWDILAEVIREHPVLLNRAPTLHRLGIQAFEPVLIEGKAIQLHPLVCAAFNADFDGDQMAVHVPLSLEAQLEAACADDVDEQHPVAGQRRADHRAVAGRRAGPLLHDPRACEEDGERHERTQIVDTTVGRALLWEIVPEGIPFEMVNKPMAKRAISQIINQCYRGVGLKATVIFADQLMYMGYEYSTRSGSSIGVNDFEIPAEKAELIESAEAEVKEIEDQYAAGLVTQGEKYNKVIDIWSRANDLVSKSMMQGISKETVSIAMARRRSRHPSTPSTCMPTPVPVVRRRRSASWRACAA